MEGATRHLRLVWNLQRALAPSHIDDAASLKVFFAFHDRLFLQCPQ
jgi:hypothetical protein